MNHYVYYIADLKTRHFYYGSRTCECDPIEDTYMGSMAKWEPEDENRLFKNIISIHKTREGANDKERELIDRDIENPFNENYHIPHKGFRTHGMKHTKETIKKMREAHKGKVISDEAKKKMSFAKRGENHWIYGKKRSKKVCENISEGRKGMVFSDEHRKNIGLALKGPKSPHYGKPKSKEVREKIKKANFQYDILQYDLEGNFIKEYPAQSVASEETGIARRAINNCLKDRSNSAGGYKWKYKNKPI